jgi:putative tricarboxylic transport membrane protein
MKRVYQTATFAFAALSAFVVWESRSLEYYTNLGPGPGFFPFWLGLVMGGLSLAWLAQVFAGKEEAQGAALLPDRAGVRRILSTLAALGGMAGLMNLLGFQLTMFLFLVFVLKVLGRQGLWITLIVALLGSAGIYRLFGAYLDVPLPGAAVKLLARWGL